MLNFFTLSSKTVAELEQLLIVNTSNLLMTYHKIDNILDIILNAESDTYNTDELKSEYTGLSKTLTDLLEDKIEISNMINTKRMSK